MAFLSMFCPKFASLHSMKVEDAHLQLLQPDTESGGSALHPLAAWKRVVGMVMSANDPDTMTMQEAMNQPDRDEFVKAMHKEVGNHIQSKHWKVVLLASVSKHKTAIPMVWSMK